jgi:hypothetical protein
MKIIWDVNSAPRKMLRKVFFQNKFINHFKGVVFTKNQKIILLMITLLFIVVTVTLFYFLLKTKEEKQVIKPTPKVIIKEEKQKPKPIEPVTVVDTEPQETKPSKPTTPVEIVEPSKPPLTPIQETKPSKPIAAVEIQRPDPASSQSNEEVKISSEQTTVNIEKLCATISNAADARNTKSFIPLNACQYLPIVKSEQLRLWPDHPIPQAIPALIEHESCITLKHSKCWNPKSQLKSAREEGAGLPQLTRAFNQDGSVRFDTLTDLNKKFNNELNELNWGNVYLRPDLQIRALILLNRDNYKKLYSIENPIVRSHFNDAAYNGGPGGVNSDRRLCGLKAGCDPQTWFENVETTCSKSKKILYANRNACDINRHHVYDVFNNRSDKYKIFMK